MLLPPCDRWPECSRYRPLADVLGHDREGHILHHALVRTGITTTDQAREADLTQVRDLGPIRVALARARLDR